MSRFPAGVAFRAVGFGVKPVCVLCGLVCICFGIALRLGRYFADIGMLSCFGLLELTLIMSVVRVSSSSSTIPTLALVVALNPFWIRAGFGC
jgi:hypothetical protein